MAPLTWVPSSIITSKTAISSACCSFCSVIFWLNLRWFDATASTAYKAAASREDEAEAAAADDEPRHHLGMKSQRGISEPCTTAAIFATAT